MKRLGLLIAMTAALIGLAGYASGWAANRDRPLHLLGPPGRRQDGDPSQSPARAVASASPGQRRLPRDGLGHTWHSRRWRPWRLLWFSQRPNDSSVSLHRRRHRRLRLRRRSRLSDLRQLPAGLERSAACPRRPEAPLPRDSAASRERALLAPAEHRHRRARPADIHKSPRQIAGASCYLLLVTCYCYAFRLAKTNLR